MILHCLCRVTSQEFFLKELFVLSHEIFKFEFLANFERDGDQNDGDQNNSIVAI